MGDYLKLDFNTEILARRHAKVPVLCVHIKGLCHYVFDICLCSESLLVC